VEHTIITEPEHLERYTGHPSYLTQTKTRELSRVEISL
jgi:hypothetical protein